jgi:hypothetical protein
MPLTLINEFILKGIFSKNVSVDKVNATCRRGYFAPGSKGVL